MPVEEVRKLINAIDNEKTEFNSLPFISKELRNLVGIQKLQQPTENKPNETNDKFQQYIKKTNDELQQIKQINIELQQQMKDMQEMLNSTFIKNFDNKNK